MTNKLDYIFTAAPMTIINDGLLKELNGNEFKVYFLIMARSSNYEWEVFVSQSKIAEDTGISISSVKTILKRLVTLGLITKVSQGVNNKPNAGASKYRLTNITKELNLDNLKGKAPKKSPKKEIQVIEDVQTESTEPESRDELVEIADYLSLEAENKDFVTKGYDIRQTLKEAVEDYGRDRVIRTCKPLMFDDEPLTTIALYKYIDDHNDYLKQAAD